MPHAPGDNKTSGRVVIASDPAAFKQAAEDHPVLAWMRLTRTLSDVLPNGMHRADLHAKQFLRVVR